MYEVSRFGWTRTPEELDKLTKDKWYRLKMNWKFFKEHLKYVKQYWEWDRQEIKGLLWSMSYNIKNLIFNRNNF
jgi:hypothetical protein